MCSIWIKPTADGILSSLAFANNKEKIAARMIQLARDSNFSQRGFLDAIPPMTRFSGEIKIARKYDYWRHRIYFTGHHTHCEYNVFYIKKFKKSGVDDEDAPRFHRILLRAMRETQRRELTLTELDQLTPDTSNDAQQR